MMQTLSVLIVRAIVVLRRYHLNTDSVAYRIQMAMRGTTFGQRNSLMRIHGKDQNSKNSGNSADSYQFSQYALRLLHCHECPSRRSIRPEHVGFFLWKVNAQKNTFTPS